MADSTASTSTQPIKRHGLSATEKQRVQLEKLSKDPAKPAFIPAPPQDKTLRPAREMMKNVQGSSAGAGSGEFHVYKAGRRREYERLKMFEETSAKEEKEAEFERLKQEAETAADSKTAKNRAKRQKKKEARGKLKASSDKTGPDGESQAPFKKRRLVDGGKELLFRKPGEESDEDDEDNGPIPAADLTTLAVLSATAPPDVPTPQVVETARIVIHED